MVVWVCGGGGGRFVVVDYSVCGCGGVGCSIGSSVGGGVGVGVYGGGWGGSGVFVVVDCMVWWRL